MEDAQEISAEDLAAVFGGVAALHQCGGDLGQIGGGVDALRQLAADAVEVRAEADVIDSGDFGDVVDVVDRAAESGGRGMRSAYWRCSFSNSSA